MYLKNIIICIYIYIPDVGNVIVTTVRVTIINTYFVMQGAVVAAVHPDDSLQTSRSTCRLRYRSAG